MSADDASDKLKRSSNRALSEIDQLIAGLRDGDEKSIHDAKELLLQVVPMSNAGQLAILLTAMKVRCEVSAREGR